MVVRFCLSAGFPFLESTILKILSEAPYLWDFNFCIFRFGWACNWTKEIFYGSNSQTPTIRRDHLVVKGLQRRRTRLPLLSVDAAVAATPVAAAAAVGSTKDRLLLRGAVAWGIVALASTNHQCSGQSALVLVSHSLKRVRESTTSFSSSYPTSCRGTHFAV